MKERIIALAPQNGRAEEKEECGGTRFLKEAGFPRTPSGKNFYMAGGRTNRVFQSGAGWMHISQRQRMER